MTCADRVSPWSMCSGQINRFSISIDTQKSKYSLPCTKSKKRKRERIEMEITPTHTPARWTHHVHVTHRLRHRKQGCGGRRDRSESRTEQNRIHRSPASPAQQRAIDRSSHMPMAHEMDRTRTRESCSASQLRCTTRRALAPLYPCVRLTSVQKAPRDRSVLLGRTRE